MVGRRSLRRVGRGDLITDPDGVAEVGGRRAENPVVVVEPAAIDDLDEQLGVTRVEEVEDRPVFAEHGVSLPGLAFNAVYPVGGPHLKPAPAETSRGPSPIVPRHFRRAELNSLTTDPAPELIIVPRKTGLLTSGLVA